jgi:uncharacterized protein
MKRLQFLSRSLGLALAVGLVGAATAATPKRVLVVSVTKGFRHDVIPVVNQLMKELASQSGQFTVDYVETEAQMAEKMTPSALGAYDGVVFNNTSGDLPLPDREGFLNWIRSGKGFAGFHAATDTLTSYAPYVEMIGAAFLTHHEQVEVEVLIEDPAHAATKHFPASFRVHDEIYLFKNFHREKVRGLLTMDKHPNYGYPGDFPLAWCKDYGKGRVFYSALGHRQDVVQREDIKKHYLGGVLWSLGLAEGSGTPRDLRVTLSEAERKEGFRPLFNGVNLDGWKLRNPAGKASWSAQNSMLVNTIGKDEHGTDLVSEEKFNNFTVRFEYMVPKASNSGFYLRGRYELQILDDHASGQATLSGNGSFYNLAAPARFVSRKPGEWQTAEVTLVGNRVTVTLNGVKIHDQLELTRPTGGELDNRVKEPGPFMLQGDHGAIAFRNLRLKVLP